MATTDLLSKGKKRVLCLGSHCDDIEIGCGGTILRLLEENADLIFYWVVFSSDEKREIEARESANIFLKNSKMSTLVFKDFKDGFFPYMGESVKECFEQLKSEFNPDLIFTHYRSDLHQDHRLLSEMTWSTFRNHMILEYEIPKYDGDLSTTNLFVMLDEETCRRKIEILKASYSSQMDKHWFSEDVFWSVLRIRGMEANAATKLAEGFHCRKMIY